jgi:type VI secretion system protein ImpM
MMSSSLRRDAGSPARQDRSRVRRRVPEASIAMPDTEIAFVTGWYGKLPARGDFVSRRLPPAFVLRWDAWLQSAIGSGSERLGTRWSDCYSSAPVWRFLLSPGLLTQGALAGVLIPSVDRVGRRFPLTIASVLAPGGVDLAHTLVEADAWFASLEAAASAALDPALDLDAYDERINALVFPAGSVVAPNPASKADRAQPGDLVGMRAIHARLESGQESFSAESIARFRARLGPEGGPCALWLARSSAAFGQWVLATAGLPQDDQFCAMLDGDWLGHGWS